VPVSHGTSHTVSVVWVQAVLTPPGHVETAAHGAHGALPPADQVEPDKHGTLHTVSAICTHGVATLVVQMVQAAHGVLPEAEKVVPATHGHVSTAQSVS